MAQVAAVLAVAFASGKAADRGIAIFPADAVLHGTQGRQAAVVQVLDGQVVRHQAAEGLKLRSLDPSIVRIEEGVLVPVANGRATVEAEYDGLRTQAPVVVEAMDEPFEWSFRNHVESVLARAGCSSGACHGALAGKNGFKLTLRGYGPELDHQAITRQARGRRIVPGDPGRSLILTKPTGALPHGGGVRFDVGSYPYQILSEWIADGAQPPRPDDPRLDRLEVLPPAVVVELQARQQLVVRAHFTDGRVEDVTRLAKFTSTNETVARVDEHGVVDVMGHGQAAVTVWYLSQVAAASVTVPFAGAEAAESYAQFEVRNVLDQLVLDKLTRLNLAPSPPVDDAEFLRRAFLDTIGVLPTAEEARRFLDDPAPDKRDRLIDALLDRPEFVDYWAYKWSDLLLVNSERLGPAATWAFYNWIRNEVAARTPWDEMVRRIVTAQGSTLENGATNYFVLHEDPLDLAETTSMAFLGMSIGCARCHNHPLEKWTNAQYYGMANLFARVRTKESSGGAKTVFSSPDGDLIQPLSGNPQPPRPLDADPLPFDSTVDRRVYLAEWLTSPENAYFSRSITNRVWANFFDVGLAENVDDLRLTNPASNEALLSAAARHLIDNRYDLRALMRLILQSSTYQRSSQVLPSNQADTRFYSRYYPRRLRAEVLLDALSQVADAPTEFPGYPIGWRSQQLPDSAVASYFLRTFGRPERVITCECERSDEPSMVQVLHLWNGETVNKKLERSGNRVDQLLASGKSDGEIIDEVFLAALSRFPTAQEKERLLPLLMPTEEAPRRVLLEDLIWGVVSSREFLFNH